MDSVFDIQIFADSVPKSSDATVSLLNKVLNQLGLKNYTKLKFDNKNDVNMHPLLNFVGNFLYKEADDLNFDQKQRQTYVNSFATLITKSISIIDDAATIILKFKNSSSNSSSEKPDVSSNIASIVDNIGFMSGAIDNLNSVELNAKKNKNSWLVPILTSSVALVFNGLTAIDGLSDEEYSKIQKSYLKFLKTAGTGIVKNILSNAVSAELNNIKEGKFDDIEYIKNHTNFLSKLSDTATKTIGIFFTLANSAVTGIDKYKSTFKTYTDDGIPEDMAKHDAVVNAIATVLHDLADYYTKGAADLIFTGTQNLVSWITGKQPKDFKNKNYIEVIADLFKNFNFKNTGTPDGDYIISYEDNGKVYGEGGGDEIRNFASHVTIWAGTGNDTVFSNREWEGKKFQANSILGGKGDDVVVSYAVGDTIYGDSGSETIDASGKDKLIMYGTSNNSRAYGEKGDDYIAVFGAKKNWVNGGLGNDIIILDGAKNATVEYGAGDGNDIIYGYDESDRIQITKGKYQMSTVGSSIVLNVDNGAITLDGAYGKTININGKKVKTLQDGDDKPTFIELIPSVWNNDVKKIIRGSSQRDVIENTASDVLIDVGSGNDYIKNGGYWKDKDHKGGSNVTINGGAGNDDIYNYYGNKVTISGEDGNDDIYSYGSKITISGGAGNDSIHNGGGHNSNKGGNNVTISGGKGNDYIWNIKGISVTMDGGSGNDNIYNHYGDKVAISSGDGNDSIGNFDGSNVAISSGAGNDSIYSDNGDNVTISGGAGNDSIYSGYGDNVKIEGGAGNDSICHDHYVLGMTINGGTGNDYIENGGGGERGLGGGRKSVIYGGTGSDSIINRGSYMTIDGGEGGDYIQNGSDSAAVLSWNIINGGAGNDSIFSYQSSSITIDGGAGNDLISLGGSSYYTKIKYASGNGKDTITGFDSDHELHITKGSYKVSTKNNDVIIKVGKGSITLKDAVGRQIYILDAEGKGTRKTYGKSSSSKNISELFEEKNFVTSDNLSEIVENNLSPTSLEKISSTNFENLTQENNLITYSEK